MPRNQSTASIGSSPSTRYSAWSTTWRSVGISRVRTRTLQRMKPRRRNIARVGAAQHARDPVEPVVHRRPGHDAIDARLATRRAQRPVAAHRDADQSRRFEPEVIQDGTDRLLPVVVERETAERARASLPGPSKATTSNPAAATRCQMAKNSSISESNPPCRSTVPRAGPPIAGQRVGGQGGAGVRDVVAHHAAVAERRIEELVGTGGSAAPSPSERGGREELGDPEIARRVAEPALPLGLRRQRLEHGHAVGLRPDPRPPPRAARRRSAYPSAWARLSW